MPQCPFIETVTGQLWTCPVCGYEARTNGRPAMECSGLPIQKRRKPSLLRRAANLSRAGIAAVADGFHRATPEQVEDRLAICHQCNRFDRASNSCNECGCQLQYKPLLRAWDCPLGKWPKF